MLTLAPGSACDVCAEEYGRQVVPHSIPCGHVLCYSCCSSIVEKCPARLSPACPYCREHFTIDGVRLIRMELSGSGWSTPRKFPCVEANASQVTNDILRKTMKSFNTDGRSRAEAKRLEAKVATVAAKKCSVEEVKTLKEELEDWLMSDLKSDDQLTSLALSAALLRAIIMNHSAHIEATKNAKRVESDLKGEIDDIRLSYEKLDSELHKNKLELSQKAHECQSLRNELSRVKGFPVSNSASSYAESMEPSSRVTSPSPPTSQSTSPTPYSSPNTISASRYTNVHARSASMTMSSRSSTPSPSHIPRSHTPSLQRSHTPTPLTASRAASLSRRSQTPGPTSVAPPVPSLPPRMGTPGPPTTTSHLLMRSNTPAPPVPPMPAPGSSSRSRRLSQPASAAPTSPNKMTRSSSDEHHQRHERWLPPASAGAEYHGSGLSRSGSVSNPVSRSASVSARFRSATPSLSR